MYTMCQGAPKLIFAGISFEICYFFLVTQSYLQTFLHCSFIIFISVLCTYLLQGKGTMTTYWLEGHI